MSACSQYSVISAKGVKRVIQTASGRRESNPVYMHPMHAYCRYTTARLSMKPFVGPPGLNRARRRFKRRSTTVRVGVARVSRRKRRVTRTLVYTRYAAADVSHTSGEILFSGCRESNPVYTHPKRAYYRYTTARKKNSSPRVRTIPKVYYGPAKNFIAGYRKILRCTP